VAILLKDYEFHLYKQGLVVLDFTNIVYI